MTLTLARAEVLAKAARQFGTPAFVYFASPMRDRVRQITESFGGRLTASFAVKSNPNVRLLRALRGALVKLDASSAAEIHRGLEAGYSPQHITFSGPAKRDFEIEYAVRVGCGTIVCESVRQLEMVNAVARERGQRQGVLIRINPNKVGGSFGLQMGGRASQFGIDESSVDAVIQQLPQWPGVTLVGMHVFSAGNSLNENAIVENIAVIADLFVRVAEKHELAPGMLVFGSGFGIPYFEGDRDLDLRRIAAGAIPVLDDLRARTAFRDAQLVLETGRWLVGPDGYLVTSVVDAKESHGMSIRLCDAGFNNHLSACGMMGTVMRRNWRFWNISNVETAASERYLLVGPLCASFDILGTNVSLPPTEPGDLIALGSSGAYGLTASPTRFISHPEPREVLVDTDAAADLRDITESALNYLDSYTVPPQDNRDDVPA